ncbi:MAG: amidohydrolase family protein [Thermodesulfobacteriota bacterium]|mgnify:CR=1 FL=1
MGKTRFLLAGSFLDGSGAAVRKGVYLAVEDEVITAIGSAGDLPGAGGEGVADFSHCVILPALVDCSVSLSRCPSLDARVRLAAEEGSPAEKAAMVARHVSYCHAHGVLGVADDDDAAGLVARCQGGTALEEMIEIRSSAHLSRGRGDDAVDRPAGDFLKLPYTGNIEDEDPPQPRLGHGTLCDLLQRKGDRKAVVVANGPEQVAEALAAGCDAIEQGYGMGEANLRRMAEMGLLWIPSVLRAKNALDGAGSGGDVACRFSQRYIAPGKPIPGAEAYWEKILAGQLAQLRLARQLGLRTAVGTGAGSAGILHGESMVEEMKLFGRAGYSLTETIRCASENGAGFFGMEGLGALAVGKRATFLIARGTVRQLPRKLSYLEGIHVAGRPSRFYRKNPVKTA